MSLRADTYLYDTEAVSLQTGLECKDASRAQQSAKDEVDINTIVKRFGLTGQLPQNVRIPLNDEFVDTLTFHDAMQQIRAAEEAFMRMPADVRSRFNNDAGAFVDFASDPANYEESVKLGLAIKRPDPPADPAPVKGA